MNSVSQYGYEYDAWLASACMPASTVRKLLDHYGTSEECHHAVCRNDDALKELVSQRFYQLLSSTGAKENLDQYKKVMDRHGIRSLLFTDPLFPASLNEIHDPPAILFLQGNTDCLRERSLAIVGSRAASYTGQKAAAKLAEDLGRHGITVIS